MADDNVPDRDIVDVFAVGAERRLRQITRRPPGAVQNGAVFADEGIARSRRDGGRNDMYASTETERRCAWITVDDALDRTARPDIDGAGWTRNRRLWADGWTGCRCWWCRVSCLASSVAYRHGRGRRVLVP